MVNFAPITAIGAYSGVLPSQQMWAYDMYPSWTPASVAYPSDSLSILNDKKLYQFDVQSDALTRQVAALEANLMPLAQQWQAQIAQWYQNIMPTLSTNINWTNNRTGLDLSTNGFPSLGVTNPWLNPVNNNSRVGNDNNNNKKEMDDKDVWKYMSRTGGLDTYGEKLLEKVKLKDNTKKTYVERLVALAKDFVTADKPELSESEFADLKAIATKMRDNEGITKADFLRLKEIVNNHLGEIDGKDDGADNPDEVDNDNGNGTKTDRSALYAAGHYDSYGKNASIANDFFEGLDGAGTDKEFLTRAGNNTTQYNIIEVLDAFERKDSYRGNLLERILDDCDNWNGGNGANWHWFYDDSAREFVQPLCEKLEMRAKYITKLSNCSNEMKEKLETAYKNLRTAREALNGLPTGDKGDYTNIKAAFREIVSVIKEAEESVYNEIEYDPTVVQTGAAQG